MILSVLNILVDVLIFVAVVVVLIGVSSIFIIKDLQKEYKKVFRIQSKFDIELRKLVNLLYKFLDNSKLEAFHNVVIKKLPHEEKRNLIKIIDEIYEGVDLESEDNKYIVETYENLDELRRLRDSKVIVFNQKISLFPFNVYAKILKIQKYSTFTDQDKG